MSQQGIEQEWRKTFRAFHAGLKKDYPDNPDGHSAAANQILDGSDQVLIGCFQLALFYISSCNPSDAGITKEIAALAECISSLHLPAASSLPLTKLIGVIHKFYSNDGYSTPLNVQILIDAVSAFVQEVSGTTLPASIRFQSTVKSTPLKTNSASHMQSSDTHKKIDPKLLNELKEHLWEADSSFFDRFFPKIVGLPLPESQFPTNPEESNVVQWFMDYHQRLAEHTPPSKITWGACGGNNLRHDLFTYYSPNDNESIAPPKHDWSRVAVVGEVKRRTNAYPDFSQALIIQLGGYARDVFGSQPGRRFVHGFSLINANMRCWVFTRSGVVASPRLALTKPSDLEMFCRVFYGYLHNTDLGFPGGGIPSIGAIELSGKVHQLDHILFKQPAIVSRGTACWLTRTPGNNGNNGNNGSEDNSGKNDQECILKNAWRYSFRMSEGEMHKRASERNVKGVAVYVAHKDGECVEDILKGVQIKASIPLSGGKKRPSTELYSSKPAKIPRTSTYTLKSGSESEEATAPIPITPTTTTVIPNRIQTWLLTHRGFPITEYDGGLALLRSMRDAIRGHRSLLIDGGILHRDISINNIMMARRTILDPPRKDGFHGFLIDLDLAIEDSRDRSSGAPERTGTFEFLSIDLLKGATDHCFYDDLQSFFFVLIWLVYDANDAKDDERGKELRPWGESTQVAILSKKVQTTDQEDFDKILDCLKPKANVWEVKMVLTSFRNVLWPQNINLPKIERADVLGYRERIYDQIDKAFEKGIQALEVTDAA